MNQTAIPATGYIEFDRLWASESGLITRGNVISSTMYGFHVRARATTECNGHVFDYGHLQAFDLDVAQKNYRTLFEGVARFVRAAEHFETNEGWIYIIRHMRPRDRQVVVHGVLVADQNNKLLKEFGRAELEYGAFRQYQRSARVMDCAIAILCH